MYERILAAIDGSKSSERALRHAIDLAKHHSAALRIVHVSEETPIYASMDTLPYPPAEFQDALRQEAKRILAEATALARQEKIETEDRLVVIDRPGQRISEAIEEEAERWPANLIVIGTHGRRGFRRILLGSVAENLIRISTSPVLLIRGA